MHPQNPNVNVEAAADEVASWSIEADAVLASLGTSLDGLTTAEAADRLIKCVLFL
jgi:hypothetical protein